MTAAVLQRACACGKQDDRRLQRRTQAGASASGFAPPIVHAVLRGAGTALDERARPLAERILGPDFSRVRIHTDARAAESATAVGALAYAVGSHIVFGAGRFAPGTSEGDHLLAHELAHVAQQGHAAIPATLAIGAPDTGFEVQAERVANHVQAAPRAVAAPRVMRVTGCEGRTFRAGNCNGACTAGTRGPGVCRWVDKATGCVCFPSRGSEPGPSDLTKLLPAFIITMLSAAAIAALVACFASGACEVAIIVGAAGAAAAAVIIPIFREAGVEVNEA